MKVYLVRHAKAIKPSHWEGVDDLRPLSRKGEGQARSIQAGLEEEPIDRIHSSPALRCRETVEPLAADRTLSVEIEPGLAEDGGVERALELFEAGRNAPILICARGSLIKEVLLALRVGRDERGVLRCQKGSVWVLERRGGEVVSARYIPPEELAPPRSQLRRQAVLDVGSTSMSLLVADVRHETATIIPVLRSRAELRLGASLGRIGSADGERVMEMGARMRAEAQSAGSEELLPVATASLRDASNGREIAHQLGVAIGAPVRILSGAEEARIVHAAVRARLGLDGESVLALDLGGGSLDLAVGTGDEKGYEASEPLGVTRLHAEQVRNDPMSKGEAEAIRERVRSRLALHAGPIRERAPQHCIAAGGTVRALARLLRAGQGKTAAKNVCGFEISPSELDFVAASLRRATHAERMEMPTVGTRRADLLPTSAIILATLFECFQLDSLQVSDWGLREGVLLEHRPGGL